MQEQTSSGIMQSRSTVPLATLNTTNMMKKAVAEADASAQIFTNYFGPTPFKRLAMTQQTADNYGQSWPQLVWLPLAYFLDDTYRHQIYGFDPRGYFTAVAPHEVAHQWWGHTVTWASYRDQWMSEGFSDAAASIFLQMVGNGDISRFLKFWNDEHYLLTERNKEGFRAIDAGPVTLGYRLNNAKTGNNVTRELIYAKGAYILHMIRMMMWNPRTGDQDFKALMQDFLKTYRNKAATTEDFKAMVEKHMLPAMDLAGNGRMDWFFDQYVYGTALPSYRLEYSLSGKTLSFTVTQSGVDNSFMMRVPIYLEFADGKSMRLGSVVTQGNNSVQQKLDLGQMGWKDMPKRVLLAQFADVLADKIEQPTK
jgi:aminopeptidase N